MDLHFADVVQAQNGSSVIGATQLAQSHVVIVFVLAGKTLYTVSN